MSPLRSSAGPAVMTNGTSSSAARIWARLVFPSPGGPPRELTRALAAGDTARFQAVPGIGKRTAERIVVELRTKVDDGNAIVITRADDPRLLARDGLVELGFAVAEAEKLLAEASGDSVEELIGAALRGARR